MRKDDVLLRGTKSGVTIIFNDQKDFPELLTRLKEKLRGAENFFQGAEVTVDIGNLLLTSKELLELEEVITREYGVKFLRITHGEEDTAPAGGQGCGNPGAAAGVPRPVSPTAPVPSCENTILVRRTLRSGQKVHYHGNVVILGDVNPGAEVVATGDIVVMGALRGVAHAGARGNDKAIVAAFRLQPTQLRIGNYISRPPEGDAARPAVPEVAQVKEGVVVIDPYQPH